MNRNQRRYGKVAKRNDSSSKIKSTKTKNEAEIEEVLPPKKHEPCKNNKPMTNRCCFVVPNQKDISQETDTSVPVDQYQNILIEQYGFDPLIPDTIKQLRELKQVLCGASAKVENSSQYVDAENPTVGVYVETSDETQWQNVENADDIEKFIKLDKSVQEDTLTQLKEKPRSIHISDVPRVKIIAEKFSRFKTNNVELRKLDEKVVCLEYDVYDKSSTDMIKPIQIMRAFFSIKPAVKNEDGSRKDIPETQLPPDVKKNFNISNEDFKRLNEKEVEIIDEKIQENKSYLDDLKKILHKKKIVSADKKKTSLDLVSLYEIARRENSIGNSNSNILTKAELQDVKDLILANCRSSVHGISRRTIKNDNTQESQKKTVGVISESIVAELLRENGKINVFQ